MLGFGGTSRQVIGDERSRGGGFGGSGDIESTCNQNPAVYCVDDWDRRLRESDGGLLNCVRWRWRGQRSDFRLRHDG